MTTHKTLSAQAKVLNPPLYELMLQAEQMARAQRAAVQEEAKKDMEALRSAGLISGEESVAGALPWNLFGYKLKNLFVIGVFEAILANIGLKFLLNNLSQAPPDVWIAVLPLLIFIWALFFTFVFILHFVFGVAKADGTSRSGNAREAFWATVKFQTSFASLPFLLLDYAYGSGVLSIILVGAAFVVGSLAHGHANDRNVLRSLRNSFGSVMDSRTPKALHARSWIGEAAFLTRGRGPWPTTFGFLKMLADDVVNRIVWSLFPSRRTIPEIEVDGIHSTQDNFRLNNPFPEIDYRITLIGDLTVEEVYGDFFREVKQLARKNGIARAIRIHRDIDMINEVIDLVRSDRHPDLPMAFMQEETKLFEKYFPGYRVISSIYGPGAAIETVRRYNAEMISYADERGVPVRSNFNWTLAQILNETRRLNENKSLTAPFAFGIKRILLEGKVRTSLSTGLAIDSLAEIGAEALGTQLDTLLGEATSLGVGQMGRPMKNTVNKDPHEMSELLIAIGLAKEAIGSKPVDTESTSKHLILFKGEKDNAELNRISAMTRILQSGVSHATTIIVDSESKLDVKAAIQILLKYGLLTGKIPDVKVEDATMSQQKLTTDNLRVLKQGFSLVFVSEGLFEGSLKGVITFAPITSLNISNMAKLLRAVLVAA